MDYNKLKLLLVVLTWRMAIANNISYEIKSLFGQPDYRSVNLTWEVDDKYAGNRLNEEKEDETEPKSFFVHYCEIQSWGEYHRCNSKVLIDDDGVDFEKDTSKIYKMTINNLRMATKYSFNVRPKRVGDSEKSARSENFLKDDKTGQSIIIPTKGFSAIATKCLPNESEILVETGPYFGGKIASENGICGIQGNAKDPKETYAMRIDHERCGSTVSHEDLTVDTYITVQENSGILTHSTRRFLVVCTFQPDTLTVRARLALPGKGDVVVEEDSWSDRERTSRNRQFKMVDKSALILKESGEHSVENAIGDIENLTEKILTKEVTVPSSSPSPNKNQTTFSYKNPRFSRYATENEKSTAFQIDAITCLIIGVALIVLIIFIAFIIYRKDRKGEEQMERLQSNAVY
ncbi:hypothetical protein ACKWTF_000613 [Chironomus riparius]